MSRLLFLVLMVGSSSVQAFSRPKACALLGDGWQTCEAGEKGQECRSAFERDGTARRDGAAKLTLQDARKIPEGCRLPEETARLALLEAIDQPTTLPWPQCMNGRLLGASCPTGEGASQCLHDSAVREHQALLDRSLDDLLKIPRNCRTYAEDLQIYNLRVAALETRRQQRDWLVPRLSEDLCWQTALREAAVSKIGEEKNRAKELKVPLDPTRLSPSLDVVAAADKTIKEAKRVLATTKTKPLSCTDQTVQLIQKCLRVTPEAEECTTEKVKFLVESVNQEELKKLWRLRQADADFAITEQSSGFESAAVIGALATLLLTEQEAAARAPASGR